MGNRSLISQMAQMGHAPFRIVNSLLVSIAQENSGDGNRMLTQRFLLVVEQCEE